MENQNHDDKRGELQALEGRVGELERIAESLGDTPDEEVVAALDRAVSLLNDINADVQSSLQSANEEVRELGGILDGLSFGSFDEALEDLEKRERDSDGAS
ncbi:MAG: hypothetical protein ACR2KW_05805 [Rubrobacter sp.]